MGRTRATPRAAHHANPLFFQWALAVDPTNAALAARAEAITAARAQAEPALPSVPTTKPAAAAKGKTAEELELEALEAEMAQ